VLTDIMARDAHAIALHAFAQSHEPLPEFPTLCPSAIPLALTSMVMPMVPNSEDLDDTTPVMAYRDKCRKYASDLDLFRSMEQEFLNNVVFHSPFLWHHKYN
jgi:hypothetical protein